MADAIAAVVRRSLGIAIVFATAAGAMLNGCAAVHQQTAQNAFATGNDEAAAIEIQSALADDPGNLELKHLAAQIFTQRGVKFYKQDAMIAAQADFQRAVDYEPTYAPAWDYLGLIAFAQHDWQTAIADGGKAAGYSGQADPLYVKQAEDELRKVQSGGIKPYIGSGRRLGGAPHGAP
jgi:tetratricopeptide (TPR) repeat protein